MGIQSADTGYGLGPVVAAIAFVAAMTTAIWLESRDTYEPETAKGAVAAPAPAKPAKPQ